MLNNEWMERYDVISEKYCHVFKKVLLGSHFNFFILKQGLTLLTDSASKSSSSEDAKLIYLKNLMVNYLCADESSDVRGPMERAIGTVLQFTDADFSRISSRKASLTSSSSHGHSSWFG